VTGTLQRLRPSLVVLVALIGGLITAALVLATWRDVLGAHERIFRAEADGVRVQLLQQVKATDEMVIGLGTLVNSATHVDADQFRVFSEELLRRHPYLISTSYLPLVQDKQRSNFERLRHEAGFPGFVITDRSGDDYRRAPLRAQYFPLLFIEPFEPLSVTMIGFDVLAETRLAQAAQSAIELAQPSAADPQLIEGRVRGYWLFAPVYVGKQAPATSAERRQAVNGLVAMRINAEQLLAGSVAARPLGAQLRMLSSRTGLPLELVSRPYIARHPARWPVKTFTQRSEIGPDGQRFILDLERAVYWRDVNYLPVLAMFLTGILTTLALVLLARRTTQRTLALERRNLEVERLVSEKTAELALEKERAQVTLASIGDAVITTDAAGRVEYLNAAAQTLTGWDSAEVRGRNLIDIFRVQPADENATPIGMAESPPTDILLLNRAQQKIAIDQTVAPILGRAGEVLGSVVVFRDVTEQRKVAREISYQATHDALTGLYNRRAFEDRLAQLLANAEADRMQHAMLYIDLDQFKIVNDACGHAAGDQLLRQLTAILRKEMRQSDLLARLGGDELGILLHSCHAAEAAMVADKLLQTVNDFRFVWKDRTFAIGASIGLVPFGDGPESAASILSAADAACYAAKDKGRNRVLLYQADDSELSQRRGQMQWVTRLKRALEEDRFVLYSQPIVRVASATEVPVMQEILLRLRDEDGTLVPPGAFLPAAERYGLMPAIDRWVVRTLLQWLARHAGNAALTDCYAINLSGLSLSDAPFLGFVLQELDASGVDPTRIAFEITETSAVAAFDSAVNLISALKDKGCRFLLDDFGSGWSSFTYLKNLPVDFLKIDGGLVRDMANDVLDEAMVRSINEIGHVLGIATIAECVESDAVLQRLAPLGVDYAQGYAVARPAPIDAHLQPPASDPGAR
jgi:diguanylate cyclase (GGDEF)-like protein/PAS domain S-box-containing protein